MLRQTAEHADRGHEGIGHGGGMKSQGTRLEQASQLAICLLQMTLEIRGGQYLAMMMMMMLTIWPASCDSWLAAWLAS